jgi:MFS family permease
MRDIVRGVACFGVALLLLAGVPGVKAAIPVVFLVGGTSVLYMTGTTTIVQMEARRDMHGRVLALQTVLLGGSAAFGGPLLGWIADTVGARALMVIGGVACLSAATFGTVATKHSDGQPAPRAGV